MKTRDQIQTLISGYETECMLRFYLGGIQYALGDLNCDDSPLK